MKSFLFVIVMLIVVFIVLYFVMIGNIDKSDPNIIKLSEPIQIIGLEINTSNKAIYKDVKKVASQFAAIKKKNPIAHLKSPWASINISKDYNEEEETFKYIMGDVVNKVDHIPNGLQHYEVPALTYAVFTIQPKSRIAWGITMGRMKKFIYGQWLPNSAYQPSTKIGDFELHDSRSLGKHPQISLYVALEGAPNEKK